MASLVSAWLTVLLLLLLLLQENKIKKIRATIERNIIVVGIMADVYIVAMKMSSYYI